MGTPEYMAPEQAAGRPADARCDVYALGAICYEMVTGLPPYSGDNFMEILTKKATQDPPPPSAVRSTVPPNVSDLVMAAMSRNPDDRPQTMETFEYELNKSLSGRGVAVAQILGMTTDPHVVATLNPGLSVRNLDEGELVRAATSSPALNISAAVRSGTASGITELAGMTSAPVSVAAVAATRASSHPMASGGPSLAALSDYASQPVIVKRSAAGVLGWLLLAAVLFGGVGTLIYVAMGERGQRGEPKIVEPPPRAAGSAPAVGDAPDRTGATPAVGSNSAVAPAGSGSAGSGSAIGDTAGSASASPKKPPATQPRTSPKKQVATADEKDPKALIKLGKSLEKQGEWDQARGVYLKLEKIRGYAGQALYMQAWAAFQNQDTNAAEQLAKQSAGMQGAHKTDAMFLYADALYRKGELVRAKKLYLSLRAKVTGGQRAIATKKIAACNKALKLPDADGI
jgi:hypothetical protein